MTTIADRLLGRASVLANTLKGGGFLTRERMRLVAGFVIAFTILVFGAMAVTSNRSVDILRRPLGTDFSSFYAAGAAVIDGTPTAPYDPAAQHAREQSIFGADTPFYAWQYPPFFLMVATPLALLPYWLALLVWQAATLLLYLWAVAAIVKVWRPSDRAIAAEVDRSWWVLALGFPAVFVNLGHGQNGFLSAAVLAAALVTLDRRPLAAGICFGLLAYKPQLGVMIPLVLLATGRWRSFLAASVTVVLLVLSTLAAFGFDVWQAFLQSTAFTKRALLEDGGPGWDKVQSIFAWVRLWGGPTELAYLAQSIASVAVAAGLVWLWRGPVRYPLKAAALAIAALLAAPFSLDYDLMVLAVAIAFLAVDGLQHGFAPYEKTVLAALWLAPLVTRGIAHAIHLPAGTMTMATAFVCILAWATAGETASCSPSVPDSIDPADESVH